MSAQVGGVGGGGVCHPQQGVDTISLTPSYHSSVCKGAGGSESHWAGRALPPQNQHMPPIWQLCVPSLYIAHQMWPSSALLREEEEEEDRGWVVWYPELGCKARHPKTNLPLLTTGPKAGACGKWGWWIAVAWGRRAGCRGQGWFGTSLAGWRSLLCTTPSPRLFQPILFVHVSLYYVSAYKSTLLWAGGGSAEDRCSSVNAVSILSPLGD